jgi:hypothetical protein
MSATIQIQRLSNVIAIVAHPIAPNKHSWELLLTVSFAAGAAWLIVLRISTRQTIQANSKILVVDWLTRRTSL